MSRFPLEALRLVRCHDEQAGRASLAAACAAEAAVLAERDARAAGLEAMRVKRGRQAAPRGGIDALALAAASRFDARLRGEEALLRAALVEDDVRLAAASSGVARARATLEVARTRLEIIDRRREAWELAVRRRAERSEEAARDDRAHLSSDDSARPARAGRRAGESPSSCRARGALTATSRRAEW